MKKNYKYGKYRKSENATTPFDGKIKQLRKETLILISLNEAKDFVKECFKQRIKVGVGSVYNGGVIIFKDEK